MFLEGSFNPVKDIKYVMFFWTKRREGGSSKVVEEKCSSLTAMDGNGETG
jgi:hypothetical protein